MKQVKKAQMHVQRLCGLIAIATVLSSSFLTYPVEAQQVQVPQNCNPYINNNKREQIIRNFGGKPQWTRIFNPAVNVDSKVYPIKFQYGDKVWIRAGGCVQTGGHGSTWKRYVNPSGSKSDRYYHGQIRIPLLTNGLVPFSRLGYLSLDKQQFISGSDTWLEMGTVQDSKAENTDPFSHDFLVLGYTDDGYGDNGYWGHDDGTGGQCRGVYGAYVDIWIERK